MKRLRISLLFVSLVLLFSLGFVSAQTTCDNPDDIIFRLDAVTNAHGEVFDDEGVYSEEICHKDIFGFLGDGNRVCSGSNLVLRLDADTNAHGEIGSEGNYDVDVCYGGLDCRSTNGACDTANGEKLVVSLSANTNAHLASDGSYDINICCSSMALGDAQWRDGAGDVISEANLNDYVWMHVDAPGIPEGEIVSFNVSEADLIFDDELNNIILEDQPEVDFNPPVENGEAFVYFQLTQPIIDAAEAVGDLELYFEASWGTFTATSPQLIFTDDEDSEPPNSIIGSPVHGQVYYSNVELGFTSESYDENGIIVDYVWEFNDGGIDRKYCSDTLDNSCDGYTDAEGNFDYTYTNPGLSTITLTVTDNEGLSDRDQVAILVISSPGIFGWIDTPGFDKIVYWEPSQNVSQGLVEFVAEESYVVEVTSGDSSSCDEVLNCVAGDCPDNTYVPADTCTANTPINPEGGGNQGWTDLNFQWTIDGNEVGTTSSSFDYVFGGAFSNAFDDKLITLALSSEEIPSSTTTRAFTLGQCIDNGDSFLKIDGTGNLQNISDTSVEGYSCVGGDLIGGTADDCCPAFNPVCADDDGDGEWRCRAETEEDILACEGYSTQSACEADCNPNYQDYEACVGDTDYTANSCPDDTVPQTPFCAWDTTTGVCYAARTCATQEGCIEPTCNFVANAGECINGYMVVSYSLGGCLANYPGGELIPYCDLDTDGDGIPNADSGAAWCSTHYDTFCANANTGPVEVPCGRLNFDLGFFDYAHFLSAALIISMIYLVMYYRREERE